MKLLVPPVEFRAIAGFVPRLAFCTAPGDSWTNCPDVSPPSSPALKAYTLEANRFMGRSSPSGVQPEMKVGVVVPQFTSWALVDPAMFMDRNNVSELKF